MPNEDPLSPEEKLLTEADCIDPNGPPQPATGPHWARGAVTTLGCLTVGGILFGMCGITQSRTMGSMRSSKLKWEERERQIEAAIQKDRSAGEDAKPAAADKDAAHE
jgi:hypothetical protein